LVRSFLTIQQAQPKHKSNSKAPHHENMVLTTLGPDSFSPRKSDLVSNLLQSISAAGSSVSPRHHDTQSPSKVVSHRFGAAASAMGTLLPFSSGWGALHPTVEVKQRPAALRASNTHMSSDEFVRLSAEMSRCAFASVSQRYAGRSISPKKSLEVPALTHFLCSIATAILLLLPTH
jgi:hypothetical protein